MCKWVIAALLSVARLAAVDTLPWYPNNLELQWTSAYEHEYYRYLDEAGHSVKQPCHANRIYQSLAVAYTEWCGAVEALFAESCDRSFGGDEVRGVVRYQFLDDIAGDAATVVLGGALAAVFPPALRDMSVFHHGRLEGDLHLLVGKEFINSWKGWQLRGWASGSFGLADHGSPWVTGEAALEGNVCLEHRLRLLVRARHGFGGEALDTTKRFHGYGPIDYTALDGVFRYTYLWEGFGDLALEYAYRFYARNCPKNSQRVQISFCYPFGL